MKQHWTDKEKQLLKLLTIKNNNIDRKEQMIWKSLPNDRYIKLYTKVWEYYHLAKWLFDKQLHDQPKHWLWSFFKYDWTLSEQQKSILDTLYNKRTWLINMKTGTGKTHVVLWLINQKQEKTLILVHSKKTLKEMKEKFEDFTNYSPWVYYSDEKEIKDVTITTHQSFVSKTEQFKDFSLLIYDECDYNLSNKMIDTLNQFESSSLFWFTGTPYSQEISKDDMQKIFGSMIETNYGEWSWYYMIPDVYRIPYTNNLNFNFESWHELREQLMYNSDRFNKQIELVQESWLNYWLVLTERKEEAYLYYEKLKSELDIPVLIMTWDTKPKDDEKNLEELRNRWEKFIIVGTAQKMSRWVDIPEINAIFLFFPCQFKWAVVQAVGRWLRLSNNKNKTSLYDWCDYPILAWQANKRLKAYKEEYQNPKIYTIRK